MPVIGIVGGDRRQEYLAGILRTSGFSVLTYGICSSMHCTETLQELMRDSRVLVAPIPFTRNDKTIVSLAENTSLGINSFISFLRSDHVVCGGGFQST